MNINREHWATLDANNFQVSLLTDPYNRRILAYAATRCVSAQELSEKLDIPIAVCYRRIKEMEAVGLIKVVERYLNRKGKRVNIYKSMVKRAKIEFRDGCWMADLEMMGGSQYQWDGDSLFNPGENKNQQ